MTMRIFNASPGFGAPLTEEEVKDFLTNSKLNVHLGTVDEKGDSNIHPVWYLIILIINYTLKHTRSLEK
jgi:hypothetical protein